MRILVSDTSVIIDLERGGLLEPVFRLPLTMAVPDILYRRELENYGGAQLLTLGLLVEDLDATGVERAQGFRRTRPALSIPDSFALALAQANNWILLSGDSTLRALAEAETIECHGVLWLLDLMHRHGAQAKVLHDGLERIVAHPRCRLPKAEVRLLLDRFGDPSKTS